MSSYSSPLRTLMVWVPALLLLVACATGTTTVLKTPKERRSFETVKIVRMADTVDVDPEIGAYFESQLKDYLYSKAKFIPGEGLTLQIRFIQLDKGSRAARYVFGFGAGKGTMTIEGIYLDADGNELSRVHVGGEISAGFFGGDFKEAVNQAAKEMGEYTVANFQ